MAKMPKIINDSLDPDDDLLAMERSTFDTFIDESQASALLLMWARQESADNEAFRQEFCGEDEE